MSSFGQNFLQGFAGSNSLRDYTHASKVFRTNAYELKPRFKFLFHVRFTINVGEIKAIQNSKIFGPSEVYNLSLAVKTVDLPKYTIDSHVLNQYNRKRVVQTKINYDPVTITFHDDGGDNIRELWYQYYSYYYKDPAQQYGNSSVTNGNLGRPSNRPTGMDYNNRDIYSQSRSGSVNDWGYIGESFNDGPTTASGKPPFFKDIQIYGFDQHKYARYVLINPLITSWAHDQYDYSQSNGVMTNSMTIAYETVKYYSGALGQPDENVAWPQKAHYDTTPSALARAGSTSTIFGQGGLLSTGQGIMSDLEKGGVMGLIGAAQKASAAYNTFKGKSLKSVVQAEAISLGKDVLKQFGPGEITKAANKVDSWVFPGIAEKASQKALASGNTPVPGGA